MGTGGHGDSVPSPQPCCEAKTALKKLSKLKKKLGKDLNSLDHSFLVYYAELVVKICPKKCLKSLKYQGEDTVCIGLIVNHGILYKNYSR